MKNTYSGTRVEYHILQPILASCANRDEVGSPKTAFIGGTMRSRISSQCWKRQVRLVLHNDLGIKEGIRTKLLAEMLKPRLLAAGATEEQADFCAGTISYNLAKDSLLFLTETEVDNLVLFAKKRKFTLELDSKAKKEKPKKQKEEVKEEEIGDDEEESSAFKNLAKSCKDEMLKSAFSTPSFGLDGLDIALFGRMVAQAPELTLPAAASFSHAISTHQANNEIDYFTALDDFCNKSAHLGNAEFTSAVYYRYIALDLGTLADTLGTTGISVKDAVSVFTKALYLALPKAKQTGMAGACPWEYARVLVRRGQNVQMSFERPVLSEGEGYLVPSITALRSQIERAEGLAGSLFGKIADFEFGQNTAYSIDALCTDIEKAVSTIGG